MAWYEIFIYTSLFVLSWLQTFSEWSVFAFLFSRVSWIENNIFNWFTDCVSFISRIHRDYHGCLTLWVLCWIELNLCFRRVFNNNSRDFDFEDENKSVESIKSVYLSCLFFMGQSYTKQQCYSTLKRKEQIMKLSRKNEWNERFKSRMCIKFFSCREESLDEEE
jgi:hypothetical protein